jgi:hypothetical protein
MTGSSIRAHDSVRSAHPPPWVMRGLVNPVVRAVSRTPLGRRMNAIVVLTFDGRRSGRHYSVPAVAHDVDGEMVVFTDAGWAANFIGGRSVTIRHAGSTYSGTGLLIEDSPRAAKLIRDVLEHKKPRALGLAIDPGHVPTDGELTEARSVIVLEHNP